jgi:hypothetical protein
MVGIITRLTLVSIFVMPLTAIAQSDSLVYQYWKRDPNTEIENTQSNQKQIITKEQLMLSGYRLVGDALQLIDGWTTTTCKAMVQELINRKIGC